MFSTFRRKGSKSSRHDNGAPIKTSPSLPELGAAQGALQWPESLVDVNSIRNDATRTSPGRERAQAPLMGPRKTSFSASDGRGPIPFHKPFRNPTDGPISSLYMSATPKQSMETSESAATPVLAAQSGGLPKRFGTQRRLRPPPNTFNIMVVGGQSTGKTSLLRLLLDTAEFSPRATEDQKAAVEKFLHGFNSPKKTKAICTACIEISDSRYDHVLLSVVDTPGLDFTEGKELKLDRQVSSVIKYIDAQYADTLNEEIKVIRTSTGDQHIHLCIFMIDPSLVMSARARREMSSMPSKTRSEVTISGRASSVHGGDIGADDEDDEDEGPFTISPAEIRAMRRIATRCNILPVISHADTLTEEKLTQVKDAVRRSMAEAGLDFGIFGSNVIIPQENGNGNGSTPQTPLKSASSLKIQVNGNGRDHHDSDDESADDEGRQSRPVIKLRPARHASVRGLSRSRSRRDLAALNEKLDDSPVTPASHARQSIANVRFSAHALADADIDSMLPFTFIAPEKGKRPQRPKSTRPVSMSSQYTSQSSSRPISPSTDAEHAPMPSLATPIQATESESRSATPLPTPASAEPEYLSHPPLDPLKGVYIRKYKWGTIDVLDPEHCDFAALRTSILSTHIKSLRSRTRQVLYEKYRMEKLLARRATQQITDEQRKQLLQELGL